jgi:uroporphyrin-III C-methyltransferase/precorrin-2 dehydrogenase/sirohydrochlorin ferrochelatase
MDYFPIFARLQDQPCLVVGGGEVGLRKVRQLHRAGAKVTCNAPALHSDLEALAEAGVLRVVKSAFQADLVSEHLLIIAATGDADVNRAVADAAHAAGRLCNIVDDGEACGFIVPSVIDRSPIVVAISSGGEAPMVARLVRQQIETWLPEGIARLASWVGGWRKQVAQRIPDARVRVRFWQDVLDGSPAEQLLAGRESSADNLLEQRLESETVHGCVGEAWLVGAGPGDPGLLTRRGQYLLQRADAVLYDRLVSPQIIDLARRDAELVCVGKQGGGPSTDQGDINRELLRRVRQGQRVCRLKGGDPFVFGRGGEELQALAEAGLPFQAVPGITAASGCAAYAGIPLTHRNLAEGVSFVTGHRAPGSPPADWAPLVQSGHTLVIYMGARRVAALCQDLQDHGKAATTPAAVVEQGTTRDQRVTGGTLATLPGRLGEVRTPGLLIVGDVARLAGELQWFEAAPESGQSKQI